MKFRPYQEDIIRKGTEVLLQHKFLYLAMEVRTGKTLTSLGISEKLRCKNVLFVTKKKAITSIQSDYKMLSPSYNIFVINYESLHKVEPPHDWDMVILDEAHSMGAFPKPSKRARQVKTILSKADCYVCLLSGTPTPESYSQMYHQVFGIPSNPFNEFVNFYKFSKKHVDVRERKINSMYIRDYSRGRQSILHAMQPYMISFTQKNAGFKVETTERVLKVRMKDATYYITKKLQKDLVVKGSSNTILADTPAKLMQKLHQLYSGTIIFEDGTSSIIDLTKAEFIKGTFKDKKIGIFYKFKAELKALKQIYGDELTTELSVFEDTDKSIALQIVSGREGISLRQAEALVYYNIDFSATSYWQSRDRMTTKDRLQSDVYWIFADRGIETKIYDMVIKKKDYTLRHFKKDLLSL